LGFRIWGLGFEARGVGSSEAMYGSQALRVERLKRTRLKKVTEGVGARAQCGGVRRRARPRALAPREHGRERAPCPVIGCTGAPCGV
jgi:hypothetical protein